MSPAVRTQTADAESASVPAVMAGMVFRRGLFARLGRAARVTQLSAPAGSGKTFLLRSWIGEAGLADRVAWVSVPGGERDPERFWISVADALRDTAAGATLVRAVTAEPDLDGWAMVERLLADLGSLRDRIWLVIDDVRELDSSEALRQLELLVMRGSAKLRFVLATRRDVRLGLHRLRLEGDLTEIRAADLRFTADEAQALLAAAGVALPASALALLHQRTEGWAAGLRLAALPLAGHPDPGRIAAEFSGSERTVAEYLLAEVHEQAVAPARRIGRPFLEAGAVAHSAWAAGFRSFALAVERSTQATELARRHGWTEEPIVAVAYLALGATRVWQMRLEEAEPLLDLLSSQGQRGQGGLGQGGQGVWGDGIPPEARGLGGSSPEGKEPLTDSETRVLRYLPTNMSAPEIAGQLSVSVNTVRTHMRYVYEKLGVHRRAGAVERARALGLLAPSPRRA